MQSGGRGRARFRRRWRAAAATLTLLGACSHTTASDLPSDRLWSSAHFDYHTRRSDTSVCPDVLGTLEEHFAELQGYFGFAWPARTKVQYYKFETDTDFAQHADCPPDAGGCAPGTNVEASVALDEHELVHAYLRPTGYPPWVLVEGVAVALSCTSARYPRPTLTSEQLAAVPSGADNPDEVYDAGAWLVGYLLDVFGPSAFLKVYAALAHDATTAAIDDAFQRNFGRGLTDVWASVLAESQPRNLCIWECSRPPITLDGKVMDSAGTCGPAVARPFSLAAEATIAFSTSAADMTLGPCGPVTPPASANVGPVVALYHLPAGQYFLRHDPVAGTIVGLADASATLNPVCSAVTDPSLLNAAPANIYVGVPRSANPWFLALPSSGRSVLGLEGSLEPSATAAVCASCGSASCADAMQPVMRTGPGDVVALTTDASVPFSEYTVVSQ